MKRSPIRRKTPMQRSAAATLRAAAPARSSPQRSKRPKASTVPQDVYEAVWHRDGGICQAHAMGFALHLACSGRVHAHHRVLARQGGPGTAANLVLICARHHTHAHDTDRAAAEAAAVIIRRNTPEAEAIIRGDQP